MAYSELLADRIKRCLNTKNVGFIDKKMMGGLCFMVKDKMCVGIIKDELMVRLDPELSSTVLSNKNCRVMDFTGRPMKGFFIISPLGIDLDNDLDYWINLALEFNPKAQSSKKK